MYDKFYRSLYRIRRVEEEVARVYPTDKVKSPVHLSIGQEAVSVGVCEALRPDDIVFGTYRGHATYLAKGGDLMGGDTETVTADLEPGKYELVCFVAGHYMAGQKLAFTVTG